MSVKRCQREVDSPEFAEWMAFYWVEAELMGIVKSPQAAEEETVTRLRGFAAAHNAKLAARGR